MVENMKKITDIGDVDSVHVIMKAIRSFYSH